MKLDPRALAPVLLLCACGADSRRSPTTPTPMPPPASRSAVAMAIRNPAPPAPRPRGRMEWWASAELVPIKGVKMPPVSIVFVQTEGESTRARSEASLQKLAPGTYHLVVHVGEDCGPRASKVGPALGEDTRFAPIVVPSKGPAPSVVSDALPFALDGDGSVTGRALVLHHDRRGEPGKPVACGVIVRDGE